MSLRVLIVEDLFIEANNLRNIVHKAGHNVIGSATSVQQALSLIEKEIPQIVLLDIFLKGNLTGIDLGKILTAKSIPFIYLSANSNETTLDAAKATQPYGFLVKPYREKDILIALDIAMYRYEHTNAMKVAQQKRMSKALTSILENKEDSENKTSGIMRVFKSYIPFDYFLLDIIPDEESSASTLSFYKRTDFDDYKRENIIGFGQSSESMLCTFRKLQTLSSQTGIFTKNGAEFYDYCQQDAALASLIKHYAIDSILVMPIMRTDGCEICLYFFSAESDTYNSFHIDLLLPLNEIISKVIRSIEKNIANSSPISENSEKDITRQQLVHIVGNSFKLLTAIDQVAQVAAFDSTVLILGETGVGKEGLAKAIHQLSNRRNNPLITINCAAIPGNLVESELFGYEKGAFTGAVEQRIGKFEQANGGTVFLDEIGEMPIELQGKLLRVIQEKELERIGGKNTIKIDVRIVAATNRNLYAEVAAGKFRIDLYYRINVFPIILAPLRERKDDIPLLTIHFLNYYTNKYQIGAKEITTAAMEKLKSYSWPGNIRELQHLIERHILISRSGTIESVDLPETGNDFENNTSEIQTSVKTIAEIEKAHIISVLKQCNGKLSGSGGAAELLQIPVSTLTSKMKKLNIVWNYIS